MARSFNGTTNFIDIGNVASGDGSGESPNYTISAWVNCTLVNGSGYSCVFDVGAHTAKYYIKSTGKTALYDNSAGAWDGTGSATLTANVWTNVIVTVATGGVINSYVGGVLDKNVTDAAVTGFNADCMIGNDAGSNWFSGLIADVAQWGIVLTAGEITALVGGARPNTIRPGNLVYWLPLDGLSSPEPDLSGMGHNGTLTGTTIGASGPPVMMLTTLGGQLTPLQPSIVPLQILVGGGYDSIIQNIEAVAM